MLNKYIYLFIIIIPFFILNNCSNSGEYLDNKVEFYANNKYYGSSDKNVAMWWLSMYDNLEYSKEVEEIYKLYDKPFFMLRYNDNQKIIFLFDYYEPARSTDRIIVKGKIDENFDESSEYIYSNVNYRFETDETTPNPSRVWDYEYIYFSANVKKVTGDNSVDIEIKNGYVEILYTKIN